MKTATNRRRITGRFARATALGLLALAALLSHSSEARAQWTTSDNKTTTPSSVGVGTTDPSLGSTVGAMFTVVTPDDTATAIATGNGVAPRFALNNHSNGSWTMYDYVGNRWNTGITQVSGNVGLGSTNPNYKLEVSTTSATSQIRFGTGGADAGGFLNSAADSQAVLIGGATYVPTAPGWVAKATSSSQFHSVNGTLQFFTNAGLAVGGVFAPTERMRIDANGNVGVGTSTPGTRLDVGAGAVPRGNYSDVLIGSGGNNSQLEFYGPTKSSAITHDEAMGGMVFYTNGPGWSPSMLVSDAGNVGIGTTTPATKLHVVGDITVTGNINAKYQDVAEWVPSTQKLLAGTVVILDAQRTNQVLASVSSYDTAVAGVISAQPGIALGEAGAGKVLVATTGRVKVKVDATRAPVRVGDLLVTSDREGYAMKSEPLMVGGRKMHSPGTIVGKALEPLASGTGEILVLLSLQ